jgi:hypothetical protein
VTSSYLWVETGLQGHAPALRHFFIFSRVSTCVFLSSLVVSHFLKNLSEDFKNLFNQSEGEDYNGVWEWY